MKSTLGILTAVLALGAASSAAPAQTPAALPESRPQLGFVPGVAKDAGAVPPNGPRLVAPLRAVHERAATALPAPAVLNAARASEAFATPRLGAPIEAANPISTDAGVVRMPVSKAVAAGQTKDIGVLKTPPAPLQPATPALMPAPFMLAPAQATVAMPLEPAPAPGGLLSGLMGGASLYYIKPYVSNNTAYRSTVLPGTPGSQVIDTSFQWNYAPAAAFWLGWAPSNGLGVRARYFFYNQTSPTMNVNNSTTAAPQTTINPPLANFLPLSSGGTAFGSPGTVLNTGIGTDVLAFASTLNIRALDLEATYGWQNSRWSLLASAGARYEVLNQGYHARLTNSGGGLPVSELQTFDATRNFSGAGPVVGLLGNVRVGQSGLSLFGSVRGAVLVGGSQERVGFQQTVNDPTGAIPPGIPGTLQINPTAVRNSDRVLSVAEIELGVQYDLLLPRSSAFFRAGVVDHNYFDAGNASQANGNLSLFGVQFSAGLRY